MNKDQQKLTLTTSSGSPIDNNQNSLTVGPNGPTLLQDFTLIDKLAHFDRERIPERVVHAKGAGAHGYFEVTEDITQYTKAIVFEKKGKKTPVFVRFSTVGGEKGSADSERDPRGFAVKFYTEQGNWDMVGNNTPVFFIRDAIKFPDFIHTQKRNPMTNLKDSNMMWDFLSLTPESCHQLTILFSDRGTPDGYRHMNGYSSHTFKLVNKENKEFYIKIHIKTDQGIKNFDSKQANDLKGIDPDYATRDLYESIKKGDFPSWTFNIQVMPVEEASSYKWNVLDITKVWPHKDYPLIKVGRLVLNKNPIDYFAEVEQSAFSPSHLIPGIEPSNDKMLQGRLFSYPDTHRHRLGVNYQHIPINCPYMTRVSNNQKDGSHVGNKDFDLKGINYEPSSYKNYTYLKNEVNKEYRIEGIIGRHEYSHVNSDYEQAGELYSKVFTEDERRRLIDNLYDSMKGVDKEILIRQCRIFYKCNPDYGRRLSVKLGFDESIFSDF